MLSPAVYPMGRAPMGRSPLPQQPPADLAAAIVARFDAARIDGLTGIYRDEAPETEAGNLPYLIFTLDRGPIIRIDSTNIWYDRRLRFTVYADDSIQANALSVNAWQEFRGRSYDYAEGFAMAFNRTDRFEGKDRGRSTKNRLVYKSGFEVSARACEANDSTIGQFV